MADFEPLNRYPNPRLPNIPLPQIRQLPSVPFMGCIPATPEKLTGKQMGKQPDLSALAHIRNLKKNLNEKLIILLEGKLPTLPRSIAYELNRVRLVAELAEVVAEGVRIANEIATEINEHKAEIDARIQILNAGIAAYQSLGETARTAIQQKTIDKFGEYIDELNEQKARWDSIASCITGGF